MAVIQKRKRGIRTSVFQYETYLSFMEDCYVFRSGTIDPTLPPNYIERKWQELTDILNRCDVGPILTSSQWQTRFLNWKNSTRQKYRAHVAEQKQTGGGPQNEKPLSALEERGLEVWGRVAVTGTPKVPHVGGLQFQPQVGFNNTPLSNVSESTEIYHIVSEDTDETENTDDSEYICIETIVPEETALSLRNTSTTQLWSYKIVVVQIVP